MFKLHFLIINQKSIQLSLIGGNI